MSDLADQMADQAFDAVMAADKRQLKPMEPLLDTPSGNAADEMADRALAAVQEQDRVPVVGQGTPDNPYQNIIEFTKKLGEATQVGASGFRESALGHSVMDGQMTYEEAQQKIDADEQLKWTAHSVDEYEKQSWKNWATGIPTSLGIETAKALPFILPSLGAYGIGMQAGAGFAATTGAGAPLAPEAALVGGLATSATFAADYLTGQQYMELRRLGANHDEAKHWAPVSGLAQGLLGSLQFKALAAVSAAAAEEPLKIAEPLLMKTIMGFGNYVGSSAKFAVGQIGVSEAQKAVDLITRQIIGTVGKNPNVKPTVGEALNEMQQTLASTLKSSIALHSAGTVAGSFLKVMQKSHDTHMEAQAAKLQAHDDAMAIQQEKIQAQLEKKTDIQQLATAVPQKQLTKAEQVRRDKAEAFEQLKAENEQARKDRESSLNRIEKEIPEEIAVIEGRITGIEHRIAKLETEGGDRPVVAFRKKDEMTITSPELQKQRAKLAEEHQKIADLKLELTNEKENHRSLKELEAETDKQIQQIEKLQLKEAKTRLKGIVKKIEPSKVNGQPNSKFSRGTDLQSVLNKIKEFVEDPGKLTPVRNAYEYADAHNELTPELQRDMDIANFVGDVEKQSAQELNKLADRIEAAYKEGRAERIQELADQVEARFQLVKETIAGLQGNTKKGYELQGKIEKLEAAGEDVPQELRDQLAKEQDKTAVESGPNPPEKDPFLFKVPFYSQNMIAVFGNWPSMIKTFFRNAFNRDEFVRKFHVGDVLNKIDAGHRGNVSKLYDILRDATGLENAEVTELLRKGGKDKITIRINGKKSSMTVNQAMDKLAQWNDPEAREALIAGNEYTPENAFTQSTAEQIEQALNDKNPAYNKIWQGYVKAYKEIYRRLANEYKEKTGVDLPSNPDYSGPMIHRDFDRELMARDFNDMLQNSAKNGKSAVASPGSTKARTGNTSALAYQDIHQKFLSYSRQSENWIGWRKPMADVFSPFMNNTEINTIIKNKFGPHALKAWHDAFEDMVFGSADKKSAMDRFIDTYVTKNIPFSVLASKPFMFVKHVVSTWNGARYIPIDAYVKGMIEFYSNLDKHMKWIGESIEFQARHSGHEPETVSSLQAPDAIEHPWSVT
ncbi:MAG: hypothetical protein KGI50_06970, partial [Patescibacteria group bacterium]|nr:hypothetical protein [Patescibacteria group bacterium]